MNHKILKEIAGVSVGTLILIVGASAMPQDVNPVKTSVAQASDRVEQTRIVVPKGYTANSIEDWHDDPTNVHVTSRLQRLSRTGMISNRFYDQKISDSREVDLNNLSSSDQYELSQYALTLINSIRTQLQLPEFEYTASAQSFANDIAKAYNKDNWSDYRGHDISAINRVAKQHGLIQNGNEYEDLGGFTASLGHRYVTVAQAKQDIYFNIKQAAFGGFYYHNNQESDKENLAYYTEWNHANDLFTGDYSQEFALSLSYLQVIDPNNNTHGITSSHCIHIDSENIENKSLYER